LTHRSNGGHFSWFFIFRETKHRSDWQNDRQLARFFESAHYFGGFAVASAFKFLGGTIEMHKKGISVSKVMALIVAAFLAISAIAGCSSSTESKKVSGSDSNGGDAGKDKVITIASREDVGKLDPHNYDSEMFAQYFIYENLLAYGEGGKIEPCLAESWDISPDGKVYTFHLRKDVKFSDGSDLTAEIVKKNYDAVLKVKDEHSWLELINQIDKTEAVDSNTFKITFKNTYYPALQELTLVRPMRILGEAGFPDNGDTSKEVKKPIGTGPWMLSEYKKGEQAVFVRNEKYWGKKPKIAKVAIKVIPDGETAASSLESGDIDMIYGSGLLSVDTFKQLKESEDIETMVSGPLTTRNIGVNSNRGFTKDLPVRMAIQYAIDKQSIVDNVLGGTEPVADTLFDESTPYCNLSLPAREFDQVKAAKLLDDGGWKLPAGKEYREKDGKQLQLDLCFQSEDAISKSISEVIQADLKKVGIKINLVGEESNSFYDRQKTGEFDLIFGESWGVPYDPHSYVSSFREPSHYDYQAQLGLPMKKQIDETIDKVLVSTDETTRQSMYKYILTTIHDQAVYVPISSKTNLAAFNEKVKNVKFLTVSYEIPLIDVDIEE
jgi:nickel transport system substrate-binding protein